MTDFKKNLIKVLITDDHGIVRQGLRRILEDEEDIVIVGESTNGRDCIQQSNENNPDIILMDIAMPGLNGIETTRSIHKKSPSIRVIILSMYHSPEHVFRALKAGASGYILKQSVGQEVVEAIREVNIGRKYFSHRITDVVIDDYMTHRSSGEEESLIERLSVREREILQLVAEGKSSKEIADLINLSPKTVETYRSRLMRKLGLSNMVELVRFAINHGIISA